MTTWILGHRGLLVEGRWLPCTIGRGGKTSDKREGDMASPRGLWTVTGLLYRPDRMARPAPWAQPILPGDLWSDDPARAEYNCPARAPYTGSHEELRRADPLYDLVMITDWNAEAVPGKGSAIFLHQWRRPGYPTAGCLAFRRDRARWLAERARPGTMIRVG